MADEAIILTGVYETLTALKEFDKDAVKRFNKVINSELAGAERDARALVSEASGYGPSGTPMSGWSPDHAGQLAVVLVGQVGTQASFRQVSARLKRRARLAAITRPRRVRCSTSLQLAPFLKSQVARPKAQQTARALPSSYALWATDSARLRALCGES